MNQKINFKMVQECDQFWDTMSVCKSGRLCSECNSIIIDFRGKTEWEIALKHAQSEKKVCGIYDKNILDPNNGRKLIQPSNKRLLLASTIGLLTTGTTVFSQVNNENIKTEVILRNHQSELFVQDKNPKKKLQEAYSDQIDNALLLAGVLTNESGDPLIGGTILIKGTDKGVVTDINGHFEIDLSDDLAGPESISIIASYIGYGREDMIIKRTDFKNNKFSINIVMNEQVEYSVFTVKRLPFHKRVWNGIKNMFKKKN